MGRPDTDWQFRRGRDSEGDKYAIWNLVHGSGRILAKVFGPVMSDDYTHKAVFYCAVPARILDTNETFHFTDSEGAMSFVDGIVAQFDPLARPKAQTPAVVTESSVSVTRTVE